MSSIHEIRYFECKDLNLKLSIPEKQTNDSFVFNLDEISIVDQISVGKHFIAASENNELIVISNKGRVLRVELSTSIKRICRLFAIPYHSEFVSLSQNANDDGFDIMLWSVTPHGPTCLYSFNSLPFNDEIHAVDVMDKIMLLQMKDGTIYTMDMSNPHESKCVKMFRHQTMDAYRTKEELEDEEMPPVDVLYETIFLKSKNVFFCVTKKLIVHAFRIGEQLEYLGSQQLDVDLEKQVFKLTANYFIGIDGKLVKAIKCCSMYVSDGHVDVIFYEPEYRLRQGSLLAMLNMIRIPNINVNALEILEFYAFHQYVIFLVRDKKVGHVFIRIYDPRDQLMVFDQRVLQPRCLCINHQCIFLAFPMAHNSLAFKYCDELSLKQRMFNVQNGGQQALSDRVIKSYTRYTELFKHVGAKKHRSGAVQRLYKNHRSEKEQLQKTEADAYVIYGDYLFEKKSYRDALDEYKKALHQVSASNIIQRYLQIQEFGLLSELLFFLHEEKLASEKHTSLLINTYLKLNSIDMLRAFLLETGTPFNEFTAIDALRKAGQHAKGQQQGQETDKVLLLAKELAARSEKTKEIYLEILIEELEDYDGAIKCLLDASIDDNELVRYLKKFGKSLVMHCTDNVVELFHHLIVTYLPQETKQVETDAMLDNTMEMYDFNTESFLETQTISVMQEGGEELVELEELDVRMEKSDQERFFYLEDFLHIFDDEPNALQLVLDFCVKENRGSPAIHSATIDHFLMRYTEQRALVLKETDAKLLVQRKTRIQQLEQRMLKYLKEHRAGIDMNRVLISFYKHDFHAGISKALDSLKYTALQFSFVANGTADGDQFPSFSRSDNEVLFALLELLKTEWYGKNNKTHLADNFLHELEMEHPLLSPILVLETLARIEGLELSHVKEWLLDIVSSETTKIEELTEQISFLENECEDLEGKIERMNTQNIQFQSSKCSDCRLKIDVPSIHFYCGHSFHYRAECLKGNFDQCPICMYEENNDDLEEFHDIMKFENKLKQTNNGFYQLCDMIGNGLMRNDKL
ncbi:hypothetical protein PCE1_004292 [Barthelona sp. PCE]